MEFPNWSMRAQDTQVTGEEKKFIEKKLFEHDDFERVKDFLRDEGFVPGNLDVYEEKRKDKASGYRIRMDMFEEGSDREASILVYPSEDNLMASIENDYGEGLYNHLSIGEDDVSKESEDEMLPHENPIDSRELDAQEVYEELSSAEEVRPFDELLEENGFEVSSKEASEKYDGNQLKLNVTYRREDGAEAKLNVAKYDLPNREEKLLAHANAVPPEAQQHT